MKKKEKQKVEFIPDLPEVEILKEAIKKNARGEKSIKRNPLYLRARSLYQEFKTGLGTKVIIDIPEVKKGYFLREVKVKNPDRKHLWTFTDGKSQVSFVFYKNSGNLFIFGRMGDPFFSLPVDDKSLYRITLYYIYYKKYGKSPKGWATKKLKRIWEDLKKQI